MISGRQTLASIDSSVETLRTEIARTARQVEERSNRLLDLQRNEIQNYRELGRLRVEHLASDGLVTISDDTEQTVQELLEKRRAKQEQIRADITVSRQQHLDFEEKRQEQAVLVENTAKMVDNAEKKTQDRLDEDGAYQAQLQITRKVERTLKHAAAKAGQWEDELESKGEPYRDDPLFMYLWKRKYFTGEYRASGLMRWLDTKVAKLIRYSEARVNFSKLQEIPRRLREHAVQVEQEAQKEYDALKVLDTGAREEDGIPALENGLKQEEEELATIDEQIEKEVADRQQQEQILSDFSAGADRYYQDAIDYLTTELRRDDLQELRQQAYATPFPEDDMIVSRLFELEESEKELQNSITELKIANVRQQERLHDMESVRAKFKREHYDRAGTGFSDPAVIGTVLGNLVNGAMTRDAFLRILQQQRRHQQRQADPGFGSGGFGRGTMWGSGMRFPSSRGGGSFGGKRGGFRVPRGGRSSGGGGFRSGGGF